MSPTFDILSITAFSGLLLFAVVNDVRHRLIPNIACIGIVILGVTANVFTQGISGLTDSLIAMAIGLLVLLPVYAFGRLGAGDVKLLASCGAFLGPVDLLNGIILAFLIGGLLGVYYIAASKLTYLMPRLYAFIPHTGASHQKIELPYGVAIAGGALLALWLTPLQFSKFGLN